MNKTFINKKLEFLTGHLESLAEYKGISLDELKGRPKELKYVEKSWSAKQSFLDLENKILQKRKSKFGQEDLKLFIDTVSFRNEIVHSYDVNLYIIWSKRNIKTVIDLYTRYVEKIIEIAE